MKTELKLAVVTSLFVSGCASVPMQSAETSEMVKTFSPPSDGNAGLYIYRSGSFGGALKKDVWVDGRCVGETAPNVFFHEEVEAGVEHRISTESEFSPNDLAVTTESGKNYFVRQYIKVGLLVGGAGLEVVDEEKGRMEVAKLKLAKKGSCSK
ncbi:MAG: DUF2846 domain-containing protein [Gammaproteobacteria bacterium]|nr:DUF2846 domain-containing protein [Gammaproteobacteria bacterium]